MGGKCSGSRKKTKKSRESKIPSSQHNGIEHYNSADIQHLLPNVEHSRPLYRFSYRGPASQLDLNERILDVRDVENDMRMETMFLNQNNVPLGRCSTPNLSFCYHCGHKHRGRCYLYLSDEQDDIHHYSAWTQDLETTPVKPQSVECIPEAVSFNSTLSWFPRYTSVKSNQTDANVHKSTPKPSFQPFQTTTTSQELLDPNRPTSLDTYQQYIVHLRQMTEDMQSPTSFQFDLNNPYFRQHKPHELNVAYFRQKGLESIQQFNNQHIYNGPLYVQQNNYLPMQQNPYPYPCPYPWYPCDPYKCPQQCPSESTWLTTPIGYHPERQPPNALLPDCTMKPTQPEFNPQFPAPSMPYQQVPPPASYANPAAQVHSGGVSFPLWMLFSYNQTNKTNGDGDNEKKNRCAHRLYERDVDSDNNIPRQQPPSNGYDIPLQIDVDSNDAETGDCSMHPLNVSSKS